MSSAFPIPGMNHSAMYNGLTKREYFAAVALQGLLANSVMGDADLHESAKEWRKSISKAAVEFADATLSILEDKVD
jgi:hypothetical protein